MDKKVKKIINLKLSKELLDRRKELVSKIKENGTKLPKGIGISDMDKGFRDYILNDIEIIENREKIPVVKTFISTQNWNQFAETFDFQDLDNNIKPPFIIVRKELPVDYGNNSGLQYRIPNNIKIPFLKVPVWNGNRKGVDIYKIPQPVPLDITYQIKLVTEKMRTVNKLSELIMKNFSSRQEYINIKGHFIPFMFEGSTDESKMDVDSRKYFVHTYNFRLEGFILDEDDFEITPALDRYIADFFVDLANSNSDTDDDKKDNEPLNNVNIVKIPYQINVNELSQKILVDSEYEVLNFNCIDNNISDYSIEVNNIIINENPFTLKKDDILKISITKCDENEISNLELQIKT